jgi:hypothetical protein
LKTNHTNQTNQTYIIAMWITDILTRNRKKKQKIADDKDDDKQSSLALLFTEQWREIFETHIVPKLKKRSDLKFLKMAFKNARDAVERSNIEVEKKFNISEFTSISQMEFAWDNYNWDENGYFGTQKGFCSRVAGMNKLEYLVWLREVKNCDWNSWTIYAAARQGNLAMVKYCVENGCPLDWLTCSFAAKEGHLDVLEFECLLLGSLKQPQRLLELLNREKMSRLRRISPSCSSSTSVSAIANSHV